LQGVELSPQLKPDLLRLRLALFHLIIGWFDQMEVFSLNQ